MTRKDDDFTLWSDRKTLEIVRRMAGLPPATEAWVKCKKCRKKYKSPFSGKTRLHHFCGRCKYWMGRQAEEFI
jgi:hypothetical protein